MMYLKAACRRHRKCILRHWLLCWGKQRRLVHPKSLPGLARGPTALASARSLSDVHPRWRYQYTLDRDSVLLTSRCQHWWSENHTVSSRVPRGGVPTSLSHSELQGEHHLSAARTPGSNVGPGTQRWRIKYLCLKERLSEHTPFRKC